MIRNWLSIAIIASLTLAFIVFWDSPPTTFSSPAPLDSNQVRSPSNILEGSTTRSFNEQGKLHYTFEAASTEHFQIDPKHSSSKDYTELSAPRMVLFNGPETPPWYITADQGRATDSGQTITLWGNVKIWQVDEQQKSELQTQYLVVKPDLQYAETDKAVMMSTAGSETRAVGMKAFLQEDKIELLSRVRGIYESY